MMVLSSQRRCGNTTIVILLSTYISLQPAGNICQYDKRIKQKIDISCPKIVQGYNVHVGGVNLMNSYLQRNDLANALCNVGSHINGNKRDGPRNNCLEQSLQAKNPEGHLFLCRF